MVIGSVEASTEPGVAVDGVRTTDHGGHRHFAG
jgi:hypothetical protein